MPKPATTATQERIYRVIFLADTAAGKAFDVGLLLAILGSVLVVLLDSVRTIAEVHGALLAWLEWGFTILFTIEYGLRLYCVRRPVRYAFSFFGIVDLLSVLPTYLSLLLVGSQNLLVIRVLRLLRIFRVFKLVRFMGEANILISALRASMPKITVFLGAVVTIVVIMGTVMFMLEGPENGFASIPRGMYWAIVTMTTVGYGDITPKTPEGQAVASGLMILGYAIIAVPTGIVSAELVSVRPQGRRHGKLCLSCPQVEHEADAQHCRVCGERLEER